MENLNHRGSITLFIGPMFSGKSTSLITELNKYTYGFKVCMFRPSIDTRTFISHSSNISKKVDVFSVSSLKQSNIDNYHVIGVDELQFFSLEDINTIVEWADINKKMIFCAGLDGDFKRKKFGYTLDLIPYCDIVHKINSKCALCTEMYSKDPNWSLYINDAAFTGRKTNDLQQIVIGDSDIYIPLCRNHHIKNNNQ